MISENMHTKYQLVSLFSILFLSKLHLGFKLTGGVCFVLFL